MLTAFKKRPNENLLLSRTSVTSAFVLIYNRLIKKYCLQEGGGPPATLQSVLVPIVSAEVCNDAYTPLYKISSTMLCAGVPQGGKDACQVVISPLNAFLS